MGWKGTKLQGSAAETAKRLEEGGDLETEEEERGYENMYYYCLEELMYRVGALVDKISKVSLTEREPLTDIQLKMLVKVAKTGSEIIEDRKRMVLV